MCNLQSNLKLNERERGETEERRARERETRERESREVTGGGREGEHEEQSPRHLYSVLAKYHQDLSLSLSFSESVLVCTECGGRDGEVRGRKERQHNAREDRETSPSLPPCHCIPSQTAPEATEILEAPLCFWLLERVKIPPCKTLSEREGSLKMFRKRCTARIIWD